MYHVSNRPLSAAAAVAYKKLLVALAAVYISASLAWLN